MAAMQTGAPTQKVIASTVAAAFTTVLIGLLDNWIPSLNASQFSSEVVVIVTFFVGYMMPPSMSDQVAT
ncbi:hypothetical protein [Roseibium marinum]|uniref:Uncharacterized protein n=1 Tax=Roseibium marinum TaxID=281252 RepID=A0A2S3UK19_9HYPH|nr:hypothetical protein [Roseibium marinum]POF27923.1 hypothetical protein CLV41_1194 [Roseibium marinum]